MAQQTHPHAGSFLRVLIVDSTYAWSEHSALLNNRPMTKLSVAYSEALYIMLRLYTFTGNGVEHADDE
ncbi:hypothetical protein N7488_001874 [Penicillium malachiteum]|nr:hypothetical protein N7488_001874 [Penicillium malachiteum]